jgi:hypothetical protein
MAASATLTPIAVRASSGYRRWFDFDQYASAERMFTFTEVL